MSRTKNKKLVVGLTGGIASGKSLVADYFHELGVTIVDTDVIAREVVEIGAPALAEIRAAFGDDVFASDGSLDRRAMRRVVFSAQSQRERLEAILHPRIREQALTKVDEADGTYVMVVVPLLYESPLKYSMDRILVVDCSDNTQLKRLMARDAEGYEDARRIIATQASRAERLSLADDVISNDNGRTETRAQVESLHEQYLKMQDEQSRR